MLETNIRLVLPGSRLYVRAREAALTGSTLTPDIVEKACSKLRYQHGLVAVPSPSGPGMLLIAAQARLQPIRLKTDSWEVVVTDLDQPTLRLTLADLEQTELISGLIERAFLLHLGARSDLWTLDSPRIFYEADPFQVEAGVAAYHRYEIGTVPIENAGIGIAVDVGVGFFTTDTLAYFFEPGLPDDERKRRKAVFDRLTQRQEGQKGTLLYDNGRSRVKCYFESAPPGLTCATTGTIRANGQRYDSLLAYYQATNPDLPVTPGTPAVRVSFKNIDYPQPVAADHVRVRVMNENVPEPLRDADKFEPADRRDILSRFWSGLGPNPLSGVAPGVEGHFWRPARSQVVQFALPTLTFGEKHSLPAPSLATAKAYQDHFRQRLRLLDQHGGYQVPPGITRALYCAYPEAFDRDAATRLAQDLVGTIGRWAGKPMTAQLVPYTSINDAAEQLRSAEPGGAGMVAFVLNEEPAAYYEAEFQLPGWRIKRVTEPTLAEHYGYLTIGAWDRRTRSKSLEQGQRRWDSFIDLVALDITQLLDIVPYRVDRAGAYEAQLCIDVGHDRRFFALSLLIARDESSSPAFWLRSYAYHKIDHHHDGINPAVLAREIVALFEKLPRRFDPLKSLLIMRDGRIVQKEPGGMEAAVAELQTNSRLTSDARVDWVEVHKDTQKSVRLWNVPAGGRADHLLIGFGVRLNPRMIAMVTTGAPTLTQATADPLLIVANGRCQSVVDAAQACFSGAQLNWSSPGVAQRLPTGMKRTDDDLKARAAQEIRRLR